MRKAVIQKIVEAKGRYFHPDLDFRAQIFNLLALIGMMIGVVIAISGLMTNAGAVNIAANLSATVLAVILLEYANRTGLYYRCYVITIVFVFLIVFPIGFFSAGGHLSGMPSFFVFAIIFTVFMLRGKSMIILASLELVVFTGICLMSYYLPETVKFFETEWDMAMDIIVGFVVSSVALGLTMVRHTMIYDREKEQLTAANEALTTMDQTKTEFFANVSHELKTPLTIISGYAQASVQSLTEQGADSEDLRRLRLISSEADRMALMVSQLLDIARMEEGRMVWNLRPCAMAELVENTLATYYPALSKNGNSLRFRRLGDLPPALVDEARIRQVIVNLIGNAVRHTYEGQITVAMARRENFVEISVSDTGEGIAPERIGLLFERYYQKETRVGTNSGTGLGLYICKQIVTAHGGEIFVESQLNVGTTVRFTVPLQIPCEKVHTALEE